MVWHLTLFSSLEASLLQQGLKSLDMSLGNSFLEALSLPLTLYLCFFIHDPPTQTDVDITVQKWTFRSRYVITE